MRLLKFLFLLLVMLVLTIMFGFFLPKNMKVSSSISISASPELVYSQVKDLKEWEHWSPWGTEELHFSGYNHRKGVGINKMSWADSVLGKCEVNMIHFDSLKSVATNFNYGKGQKSTMVWLFDTIANKTVVNWAFKISELSWLERYFAFFSDNTIKEQLEKGLTQLKVVSEELKYSRIDKIEELELQMHPAVTKTDSVIEENVQEKLVEMDNYLKRFFDRRGIQPVDSLFTRYYGKVNDTLFKVEVGYAIPEKTWVWKILKYNPLPDGRVVLVKHLGSAFPQKAYDVAKEYLETKGYVQTGIPWHMELFDRLSDTDSTNWETRVYFPVGNSLLED